MLDSDSLIRDRSATTRAGRLRCHYFNNVNTADPRIDSCALYLRRALRAIRPYIPGFACALFVTSFLCDVKSAIRSGVHYAITHDLILCVDVAFILIGGKNNLTSASKRNDGMSFRGTLIYLIYHMSVMEAFAPHPHQFIVNALSRSQRYAVTASSGEIPDCVFSQYK
jgi:hypothetical protein